MVVDSSMIGIRYSIEGNTLSMVCSKGMQCWCCSVWTSGCSRVFSIDGVAVFGPVDLLCIDTC